MHELMVYFIYSFHVYHPFSLLDKPLTRIFRNFTADSLSFYLLILFQKGLYSRLTTPPFMLLYISHRIIYIPY
ncbi:hypothetical protein C1T28_00255 [Bacillus subtilis]|nr:hypothetical protein C1T28_00255 [Bacillus subtilis]